MGEEGGGRWEGEEGGGRREGEEGRMGVEMEFWTMQNLNFAEHKTNWNGLGKHIYKFSK